MKYFLKLLFWHWCGMTFFVGGTVLAIKLADSVHPWLAMFVALLVAAAFSAGMYWMLDSERGYRGRR